MAKYSDIVAGLTVGDYGQAGPAGFTSRFTVNGSDQFNVNADAEAPSGKYIELIKDVTSRTLYSYDAANADVDRETVTQIALVRIRALRVDVTTIFGGLACRAGGSAGSENAAISTLATSGANIERIRGGYYNNGSAVLDYSAETNFWANNNKYWIKQTASNAGILSEVFAENDLNGTPLAALSTGANPSQMESWIGFFVFSLNTRMDILYWSIGTGADLPDPPSGAAEPVLTLPTGTTTGSTTASGSVTTDTASGTLYAVVTTSATAPSKADIIAGTGAAYATSQAVTEAGVQNVAATGLAALETYYWHFLHNDSNVATSASFTTDAAPLTPPDTAPTGLTAVAQSDTVIRLTWDALADVTGYKIRRDGVTVTDVGNVLTFDVTGLTQLTQYSFEVLAYNSAGDGPYSTAVLETTQATPSNIVLLVDIDGSNVSGADTVIVNPDSLEPRIEIATRLAAGGDSWRHISFALSNAEGKRPVFALNRANMTSNLFNPASTWLPMYTTDGPEVINKVYVTAPSRSLIGGAEGTIEFQFTDPLPAGTVYVMTHPMGNQAEAATLAAEMLADYPVICSPTTSSDSSGVYLVTPAEVDENGRQIGQHNSYSLKFEFGGSTTDGGPKRKLVMTAGQHAAGEASSWLAFVSCLKYILDSPNADAVRVRSNFDVYCYFNITANGVFGGHRRTNFRSVTDPNRDWVAQSLAEVSGAASAIIADTSANANVVFDWHCYGSAQENFIALTSDTPNARRFLELGEPIFGEVARTDGWSEISTGLNYWAYANLNAQFANACECPQRGNTSAATYQNIGVNWAKTLAAADADGMFYTPPVGQTVSVTWPMFDVSTSQISAVPVYNSAVAASWPMFAINASQGALAPSYSSSAAITWPLFTVAASQSQELPVGATAIAVTWPMLSVSASQDATVPVFTASIAAQWPLFAIAADIMQALPQDGQTVDVTWPMFAVSGSQSAIVPEYNLTASATWPMFSVSGLAGEFEYFTAPNARIILPSQSRRITL